MPLDTIEQYEVEGESERDGWRGLTGRLLTFTGFIVLANAFLIALLFRHMLSARNQVLFAAAGGIMGVTGMLLRGNKREHVRTAIFGSITGILLTAVMSFLLDKFSVFAVGALMLVLAWLIQRLEERAWKKL